MNISEAQTLPKYEVFICGSSNDSGVAAEIAEAFDKAGISYFNQPMSENEDVDHYDYIFKVISSCQVFLLLASENSYTSKFVKAAITYAFNEYSRPNIIPYIIDGSKLPPGFQFIFSSVNWRDRRTLPIVPGLVDDICVVLGRTVSTGSDNISFDETSYFSLGEGHKNGITALNIDKKSETIISGAKDGTVCLWDTFMGELKTGPICISDDCDEITGVHLLNDGGKFVAGDGKHIRFWDIAKGECVTEFKGSTFTINPSGRWLAITKGHNVGIYDLNSLDMLFEAEVPMINQFAYPSALCFSPDGKQLAIGDYCGLINILDIETRSFKTPCIEVAIADNIFDLCYSPNGKKIFAATGKGVSVCTELNPNLKLIATDDVVESVSSSPDGKYFATADYVGQMRIYRTADGEIIFKRKLVDINRVMFAPDGSFLATGDIYGSVAIWPLYNS